MAYFHVKFSTLTPVERARYDEELAKYGKPPKMRDFARARYEAAQAAGVKLVDLGKKARGETFHANGKTYRLRSAA
jgi:hypothetical protein